MQGSRPQHRFHILENFGASVKFRFSLNFVNRLFQTGAIRYLKRVFRTLKHCSECVSDIQESRTKARAYIEQDDSDWEYSEASRNFTPGTPYRDRYQRRYASERPGGCFIEKRISHAFDSEILLHFACSFQQDPGDVCHVVFESAPSQLS